MLKLFLVAFLLSLAACGPLVSAAEWQWQSGVGYVLRESTPSPVDQIQSIPPLSAGGAVIANLSNTTVQLPHTIIIASNATTNATGAPTTPTSTYHSPSELTPGEPTKISPEGAKLPPGIDLASHCGSAYNASIIFSSPTIAPTPLSTGCAPQDRLCNVMSLDFLACVSGFPGDFAQFSGRDNETTHSGAPALHPLSSTSHTPGKMEGGLDSNLYRARCYNPSTHVCVNDQFLCPVKAASLCGNQCYDSTNYRCISSFFLCPSNAPFQCGSACYHTDMYECGADMKLRLRGEKEKEKPKKAPATMPLPTSNATSTSNTTVTIVPSNATSNATSSATPANSTLIANETTTANSTLTPLPLKPLKNVQKMVRAGLGAEVAGPAPVDSLPLRADLTEHARG